MSEAAVLAIDQGTSGTKAVVVDAGKVVAVEEVPIRPQYRDGGVVEQDPRELLESVLSAGRRALERAARPVQAVALANQGESVLAWDRATGEPLTPILVWQDGRAAQVTAALVAGPPAQTSRPVEDTFSFGPGARSTCWMTSRVATPTKSAPLTARPDAARRAAPPRCPRGQPRRRHTR